MVKVDYGIDLSFAEDMIKSFPKIGLDKLYYSIKGKLEALSIKYRRDKFRTLMRQEASLKAFERGFLYVVTETIHSDRGL